MRSARLGAERSIAVRVLPRHRGTHREWLLVVDSSHRPLLYTTEYIVEHLVGNVHTGRSDAVAKLHRGIDFIDQQAALWVFQHVDCQDTASNRLSGTHAQAIKLRCDRTVAGNSAPGGIRYPVFAGAIDCADRTLSDDKGTNITQRLCNVFLYVVDVMLVGAKCLLVF